MLVLMMRVCGLMESREVEREWPFIEFFHFTAALGLSENQCDGDKRNIVPLEIMNLGLSSKERDDTR